MRQIKKHLKRLHKVRVHHNRWLIWTIALSSIVLLSLYSYIQISQEIFEQRLADPSILYRQGVLYKDVPNEYSLRHPSKWGVEADENIVSFNDPNNFGQSLQVGVYETSDERVLRRTLDIENEQAVIVGGRPGRLLEVKDGASKENVVFVTHNDQLYVIRGNTPVFTQVMKTFKFGI